MPNLNQYIEAQLKKGYSIGQIKADLNRRGYPPEAVAELDKLNVRKEKKPSMAVFALLLAIIVISLVFMPNLFKQQDLVQQILQDEKIIDPNQEYKGFDTILLFAHRISGRVAYINQSMIGLEVNESTIAIPRAYPTPDFSVVHFQIANNTRTIVSRQAIDVGDRITMARYTNAVTNKDVGMTLTIHG